MRYRRIRWLMGFDKRQLGALALAALMGAAAWEGVQRAADRYGPEAMAMAARAVTTFEQPAASQVVAALEPMPARLPAEEAEELPAAVVWDLPNLDHDRVDDFVDMFTGRKRGDFSRFLTRMGHYQPMISAKLEERGMPQDLIYLAMIESGFQPKAYSPAAASGIWQFIAGTGSRYGLDINRAVDERNDPEKATDAALTYLQELHDRFGSWYLAAAAYNTGENRVGRIMRQVTGSEKGDEYSYYRIRGRLPRETRDYVPLMVAAARIAKEPHKYGFEDVAPGAPLEFDRVTVGPASSLSAIASAAGTTVAEIKRLNPQLKLNRTRNDQPDVIRIPAGARVAFQASWPKQQQTLAATPARAESRSYRVRRGDNLIRIARRHGTTVAAIKRANGMRGSRIYAGAVLRIPAE